MIVFDTGDRRSRKKGISRQLTIYRCRFLPGSRSLQLFPHRLRFRRSAFRRTGLQACGGLLYIAFPILGSLLFGINGMWAGFVVSPLLTLIIAYGSVYLRFGRESFPFLLKDIDSDIEVLDDILTPDTAAALSERVGESIKQRGYPSKAVINASLFVEEIGLTVLERNRRSKKPVLFELSLFFEEDSVLIIERNAGELFDVTDPNIQINGLSGFILSGLMEAHKEKAYLVTTGYNRNMIRFSKS